MKFDLPTLQGLVRHFQTLQGLSDWSYTVEIVPGLAHEGEPAWATVESDPVAKTAAVRVRDLVSTPVPGIADPWTELCVTISHELWHNWTTVLLANPTVENEEALVEAAAQAVVRAAGRDARILARSIDRWTRGLQSRSVRARIVKVSALATRARNGGKMDPKMIAEALDALIAGDTAKCAELLKGLIANAAGAAAEPDGDELAPAVVGAKVDPAAGPPMAGGMAADDAARKARKATMDIEDKAIRARHVAAVEQTEKSASILRATTIRARIHESRTIDKATISPEAEKLILGAHSIEEAEIRLTLARGSAATTQQRGRAVDKDGKPVEVAAVVDAESANLDGLAPNELVLYHQLSQNSKAAGATYAREAQAIRARKIKANAANGDAS